MMLRVFAIAAVVFVGLTAGATAQSVSDLGPFKDWNAYSSDPPEGKTCFIATRPTDSKYSQPASGRKDAYFQITRVPSKGILNEASSIAGYTFMANADVAIDVDGTKFKMFLDASQPDTTWVFPEEQAAVIEAMKKGHVMTLQGTSKRKTVITDTYSLSGISAALDKITQECP